MQVTPPPAALTIDVPTHDIHAPPEVPVTATGAQAAPSVLLNAVKGLAHVPLLVPEHYIDVSADMPETTTAAAGLQKSRQLLAAYDLQGVYLPQSGQSMHSAQPLLVPSHDIDAPEVLPESCRSLAGVQSPAMPAAAHQLDASAKKPESCRPADQAQPLLELVPPQPEMGAHQLQEGQGQMTGEPAA